MTEYEVPVFSVSHHTISDYAASEDWQWFCDHCNWDVDVEALFDDIAATLRESISNEMVSQAISDAIQRAKGQSS